MAMSRPESEWRNTEPSPISFAIAAWELRQGNKTAALLARKGLAPHTQSSISEADIRRLP